MISSDFDPVKVSKGQGIVSTQQLSWPPLKAFELTIHWLYLFVLPCRLAFEMNGEHWFKWWKWWKKKLGTGSGCRRRGLRHYAWARLDHHGHMHGTRKLKKLTITQKPKTWVLQKFLAFNPKTLFSSKLEKFVTLGSCRYLIGKIQFELLFHGPKWLTKLTIGS